MLGRYTLRVLFCQSVAHDEQKDRLHGWAAMNMIPSGQVIEQSHGFFLFPSFSALTGVSLREEELFSAPDIGGQCENEGVLETDFAFVLPVCESRSGTPDLE